MKKCSVEQIEKPVIETYENIPCDDLKISAKQQEKFSMIGKLTTRFYGVVTSIFPGESGYNYNDDNIFNSFECDSTTTVDDEIEFQDCIEQSSHSKYRNSLNIDDGIGCINETDDDCHDAYSSKEEMVAAFINSFQSNSNEDIDSNDVYTSTMSMTNIPPGIPELPHHYIERPEVLSKIIKRLRAAKPGMIIVITTTASENNKSNSFTSGIGKSILASATVRQPEIRLLFDGGIFWLHIGNISEEFSDLELFRIAILDDVCNDRIVHLFQELGFILLITTRNPQLFSNGNIIGSLLSIDDISQDFRIELLSHAARMDVPQQLPHEAYKLFDLTHNILELSMLGAMAVERAIEPQMWKEIYTRRQNALQNQSCTWIDIHANEFWSSIDIAKHKGVIVTTKLSLSGLTAYIQDYYLALVVLPKGFAVNKEYLSMLWDIHGDFLSAVISLLLMRCLLSAELHLSGVRYKLHNLQTDCLLLQAVTQSHKLRRKSSQLNRASVVIQTAVDRTISKLTDPKWIREAEVEFEVQDDSFHTFTFDCACWLRLELISKMDLCEAICPAESFQHRINLQMAACEVGDMCRYIGYACRVLEHRGDFHPTLIIWYKTALDFLEREGRADTIEAASLMNSLGLLSQRLGKNVEAVDIHFKAALILENLYGNKNIDVSLTYAHIGMALKSLGHIDDAIHMLRKSLFITIETNGVENPTVARTLSNLSHLLSLKGSSCESIAGFEAAVNIFELALGPNHPESVMTSAERGIAFLQAGEILNGLEMVESGLITLKRHGFCEDDPYIIRLRSILKKYGKDTDVLKSKFRMQDFKIYSEIKSTAMTLSFHKIGMEKSSGRFMISMSTTEEQREDNI
eukprot:gene4742-9416_t